MPTKGVIAPFCYNIVINLTNNEQHMLQVIVNNHHQLIKLLDEDYLTMLLTINIKKK